MKNTISLVCQGVNRNAGTSSYRMDLNISNTSLSTTKLFIKQRYTAVDSSVVDVFVGVASASDLEDYAADNPATGATYYRTDTISLSSSDPSQLESAKVTILAELQLLADQMDILDSETAQTLYSIQADQITESE